MESESKARTQDEGTCPVCGQEFVHHKESGPGESPESLRDDMTQCVRTHYSESAMTQTKEMWVHKQTPTVTRVTRNASSETESNIERALRRLIE